MNYPPPPNQPPQGGYGGQPPYPPQGPPPPPPGGQPPYGPNPHQPPQAPGGGYPPGPAGYGPPPGQQPQPGYGAPYAQQPYPQSPYGGFGGPQPASWGQRFGARFIDGLIIGIPLGLVYFVASILFMPEPTVAPVDMSEPNALEQSSANMEQTASDIAQAAMIMAIILGVVSFIVSTLYEGLFLSKGGATPGKRALKLRVVPLNGAPAQGWGPHGASSGLPTGTSMVRGAAWSAAYVLQTIPLLQLVAWIYPLLNGLWPLWDQPYQQSLNDKFAKTRVVRTG